MIVSTKAVMLQTLLFRHTTSRKLFFYMIQKIQRIFTTALFAFAPIWKQSKYLSKVGWASKLWYIHIMECK